MEAIIIGVALEVIFWIFIGVVLWIRSKMDVVNILEKKGDTYRKLASINVWPSNKTVKYNKKMFTLNDSSYMKGGNVIYHIDYNTGKAISLHEQKTSIAVSPDSLDTMYSDNILKNIAKNLTPASSVGVLMIILPIICLGIGIAVGYFLHGSSPQQTVENIRYVIENYGVVM